MRRSILTADDLAEVRRIKDLRQALRTILHVVGWRGATVGELTRVVYFEAGVINRTLMHGTDFSHCPSCNRWFYSRGRQSLVPKGTCHDIYVCPLADLNASEQGRRLAFNAPGTYVYNKSREVGVRLQKIPLSIELRFSRLQIHKPIEEPEETPVV